MGINYLATFIDHNEREFDLMKAIKFFHSILLTAIFLVLAGCDTGPDGTGPVAPGPVAPVLVVKPEDQNYQAQFGDVPVTATKEAAIQVMSSGEKSFNVNVLPQLAPPFSIVQDNCSSRAVPPGSTCTFTILFAPTAAGSFSHSFDFPFDAANKITVNMSGRGIAGDTNTNTPPTEPTPPGASLILKLEADIKLLRFSWNALSDATEYRLMGNLGAGTEFSQVIDTIPANVTNIDYDISFHRFTLNEASYRIEACNNLGCNTVSNEVDVLDVMLDAIGYIKSSQPSFGSEFGRAVALSGDGNTLAVGAGAGLEINTSASDVGEVYIFARGEDGWYQQAQIKASNRNDLHQFGSSVALSADGNTLLVGAPGEDSASSGINGSQNYDLFSASKGAAYLFTRSGTTWNQTTYIKASNPDIGDAFGEAVAISADGNTLAVAASGEDSNATGSGGDQDNDSITNSGAVYLFLRSSGVWAQKAYVKASNPQAGDGFGSGLALSGDGNTLAVTAQWEDSNAPAIDGNQLDNSATDSGAAYVFTRSDALWVQQAYVKAASPAMLDEFGSSVALNGDGSVLAVGAYKEDGIAVDSGAVYTYQRTANVWSQARYIKSPNAQAGDGFGGAVALNRDGDILAAGASGEDSIATGVAGNQADNSAPDSGAVYLFSADAADGQYVKATNTRVVRDLFGTPTGDRFGSYGAVSISGDGNTLAVGALFEDGSAAGINGSSTYGGSSSDSGAVYLY